MIPSNLTVTDELVIQLVDNHKQLDESLTTTRAHEHDELRDNSIEKASNTSPSKDFIRNNIPLFQFKSFHFHFWFVFQRMSLSICSNSLISIFHIMFKTFSHI